MDKCTWLTSGVTLSLSQKDDACGCGAGASRERFTNQSEFPSTTELNIYIVTHTDT